MLETFSGLNLGTVSPKARDLCPHLISDLCSRSNFGKKTPKYYLSIHFYLQSIHPPMSIISFRPVLHREEMSRACIRHVSLVIVVAHPHRFDDTDGPAASGQTLADAVHGVVHLDDSLDRLTFRRMAFIQTMCGRGREAGTSSEVTLTSGLKPFRAAIGCRQMAPRCQSTAGRGRWS